MKKIDKIIQKLENYITNNEYEPIESESFELKNQPANAKDKDYDSIKESICAFLNTNEGILLVGIKEDIKNKKYIIGNGYNQDFEANFKTLLNESFEDFEKRKIDISDYIRFEIKDFLDKQILVIYVEKLPADKKYAFLNGKAYQRKLTGDHEIDKNKISAQEGYKKEIENSRELFPVLNATIQHISVDKLNDYIYQINKEIKIETTKNDIEQAKSFLLRKFFITKEEEPTILGMLVCGEYVEDYLGNRCEVDCFVNSPIKIAQNKKILKDNILNLFENSFNFIYRNIAIGISAENGGTPTPEYPEDLIRECINNSLAHRDYTVNRCINIDITPQKHIEIRNPGGFKKELLIEQTNHAIPLRLIIPNQKAVNPKLADILKVFNKYEGKGIGMATLVNECLKDNIDLPYYKFKNENDITLVIPSGKLLDNTMENIFENFSGFLENLTQGKPLTEDEKHVISYLYKSEKENENFRYTILLTHDNNHLNAITSLKKAGIIYQHELSTAIQPIFVLHRELMKTDFNDVLIKIFGKTYIALDNDCKNCLNIIYQINTYSKIKDVSVSQIGNILYFNQHKKIFDIKIFESFRKKIILIFDTLEQNNFIKKENEKYVINLNFLKSA